MSTEEIINKLKAIDEKAEALDVQVKSVASQRNAGIIGQNKAPFARIGEDIMSSRPFSFAKLIGCLGKNGRSRKEDCKVELEYADRFTRKMIAQGYRTSHADSLLVPIAPELFGDDTSDADIHEMKGLMGSGGKYDVDEHSFWARKASVSPALSWIDQSVGGAFVPPPSFGPPIELLRNHEVMMQAGATVIPLGPSGRIVFPRLTQATQGGWSGENVQNTPTQPNTGQLELSAKKVISTVALPGELLRFGSPAVEAVVRNDLMKTVALIADKGLLDGAGSNNVPLGLATMCFATNNPYGCQVVTPTNANQLAPQDIYQFQSLIEEANGTATCYIMRPKMKWTVYGSRWTPYSSGTSQGGFTFDFIRGPGDKFEGVLAGLKVVDSVQVSTTRGSGAQTYVLAINAPDYYLGMFGAIEFTQSDAGWTLLSSDQVAIRAILTCDGAPRHPSTVAGCDALNYVVAG